VEFGQEVPGIQSHFPSMQKPFPLQKFPLLKHGMSVGAPVESVGTSVGVIVPVEEGFGVWVPVEEGFGVCVPVEEGFGV